MTWNELKEKVEEALKDKGKDGDTMIHCINISSSVSVEVELVDVVVGGMGLHIGN